MDVAIAPEEQLANYLLESSKIKGTSVDHRAFLPGRDGERSVFRIDGLCKELIATTGQAFVLENRPDKQIVGWAAFKAADVFGLNRLRLRADEPPPRHAVIDNWPAEPEERRKLALELARASECCLWP